MILKRKVSDFNNNIVPTKTAITDDSNSQEEGSSCAVNEKNMEDVPGKKLGK